MAEQDRPSVFFFTMGRTLSHLFCKLVWDQPGWNYGEYYFHESSSYWRKDRSLVKFKDASAEEMQEYLHLLHKNFEGMQADITIAKSEGKPIFIKNHIHQLVWPSRMWEETPPEDPGEKFCLVADSTAAKTNPTILPDEFLESFVPIFIIRHPAAVAESCYRAESRIRTVDFDAEVWAVPVHYKLSRDLYDWFCAKCPQCPDVYGGHGPFYPLVIEADNLLDDGSTISNVCRLINMDPTKVPSEWEPEPLPVDAWTRSYVQDFVSSTGIDKSKSSKNLNMKDKYEQWGTEFGRHVADSLYKLVERDMGDYLYLKERCV